MGNGQAQPSQPFSAAGVLGELIGAFGRYKEKQFELDVKRMDRDVAIAQAGVNSQSDRDVNAGFTPGLDTLVDTFTNPKNLILLTVAAGLVVYLVNR